VGHHQVELVGAEEALLPGLTPFRK
jgi:hypothetical protein